MPGVWDKPGIIVVLMALLSGLIGLPGPAWSAERILSFESRIVIHEDAALTVTETITVLSAGQEIKRGIVRELPTRYQDRYGNTVRVGFQVLDIRRDGRPEPYRLEKAANGVRIFIGQKEVFLPPGRYTYTIIYRTDRQLGYFPDYDELYWNVTGTGWTFAIDAVRAVVHLPPGAKILQHAAYTGPFGASGQDFRVGYTSAGDMVFTTTRGLAPAEGLTIAVAWPKGIVREPAKLEKTRSFLLDNAPLVSALVGLLALLGYYLLMWSRVGRDPAKGAIIPLFEPPAGFSPAACRFVMRMGFDPRTFAAAVIGLAVKGFVRLQDAEGTMRLEKSQGRGQLFPEEKLLERDLFSGRQLLEIDQKNQRLIASTQEAFRTSLQRTLSEHYFKTNRKYLWPAFGITLATLAAMVLLADEPAAAAGSIVFYVFTGVAFSLFYLQWEGVVWYRKIFLLMFGGFWLFFSVILGPAAVFGSAAAPLAFAGIFIVHLLFAYLLKAPTFRGRQVMDQIEGFKMYLGVAEQERLEQLHPPAKTPELFEKYLPYALALDVENEWSEQFAGVLSQAAQEQYQPSWYQGSSWDTRNLSGFSRTLGSGLAASIAAAATPPSSSSGSGGGGSSGGGGGGGGGSGW